MQKSSWDWSIDLVIGYSTCSFRCWIYSWFSFVKNFGMLIYCQFFCYLNESYFAKHAFLHLELFVICNVYLLHKYFLLKYHIYTFFCLMPNLLLVRV